MKRSSICNNRIINYNISLNYILPIIEVRELFGADSLAEVIQICEGMGVGTLEAERTREDEKATSAHKGGRTPRTGAGGRDDGGAGEKMPTRKVSGNCVRATRSPPPRPDRAFTNKDPKSAQEGVLLTPPDYTEIHQGPTVLGGGEGESGFQCVSISNIVTLPKKSVLESGNFDDLGRFFK